MSGAAKVVAVAEVRETGAVPRGTGGISVGQTGAGTGRTLGKVGGAVEPLSVAKGGGMAVRGAPDASRLAAKGVEGGWGAPRAARVRRSRGR